jgi:hypothetical protein
VGQITGTGNSGFDVMFFVLEGVALALGVVVVFFVKHIPPWSVVPSLVIASVIAVGTPIYWYIAYPPLSGLDGAGRILFGVPVVLVNVIVIGIGAYRAAK